MTKLNKVLKFVRQDGVKKPNYLFSWKKFTEKMDCTYPCTETNYLNMLVKAQYVERVSRGQYRVNILPGFQMSYSQLKQESQLNWRK